MLCCRAMKKEIENDTAVHVIVPSWVKAELFEPGLRKEYANFDKIVGFKAFPALRPGENYATIIIRIAIEVALQDKSQKKVSYIMKLPHDFSEFAEAPDVSVMFSPETIMYSEILPELEQIYRDANVDVRLSPKAHKLPTDRNNWHILLEDLQPKGYKNRDRLLNLDMEHTKCALQKLAQYHAVTACRIATRGNFPSNIMRGIFAMEDNPMFDMIVPLLREGVEKNVPLGKYAKAMGSCFDNFTKALNRMQYREETDFAVLTHGDYWCNNILFQYDKEGNISDTLMIDFQLPSFGSPAQDLFYFILSSVHIDIKLKHFDFFIRYYFDNLIEHLELLKYPKKIPTLREIYIQLFKNSFWVFHTITLTLPIVLLESTSNARVENFMRPTPEGNEFRNALYSNKRYHSYLEEVLPWIYNYGFLEGYDAAVDPLEPVRIKQKAKAPPAWLSEEYFVEILKENIKDFKKIKSFDARTATNAGDNYSAKLYKVDIAAECEDGSTKSKSFMLKVAPESAQSRSLMDQFGSFKRELIIYDDWLPRLENILKEAGINTILGPQQYKFSKSTPSEVVLLDNLRVAGYKNADRLTGLDEAHVKCVLEKLAQFHAASAHWAATKGEIPELLERGLYTEENRPMMEQMGAGLMSTFAESVKLFEGSEEYIDKIDAWKTKGIDVALKNNKVDPNAFNVLNHGDCWTNNIMFKYDINGQIESTQFVDFQLVKYGTPAQDLYYFLMSSPALNVKVSKFDHFIQYYHEHLSANLKLLKYPKHIPTLKELNMELLEKGAFAVGTVYSVMAVVLLEPTEKAEIDDILENNNFQTLMYTNERYRKHAEKVLLFLNRRGLLDIDENV